MVRKHCVRLEFTGYGVQVDSLAEPADRLYLEVGNRLEPGIIDQHHLASFSGSTARLVLQNPELIDCAVSPRRAPTDPFTIVLHMNPDLDCLASTYLAIAYLEHGTFSRQAEALVAYIDQVDQGYLGASHENPFSLYSAYNYVLHRLTCHKWNKPDDMWAQGIKEGLEIVEFVLAEMQARSEAITKIDAFACPGLFGPADRHEIQRDLERYRHKLQDPASHARVITLCLLGRFGGQVTADTLLIRDVQNYNDPERCLFFKDWARADRYRSPYGDGFIGLCVFESETSTSLPRCIISVRPDSGASLKGLGMMLDQQEAAIRIKRFGVDDRVIDPKTQEVKRPRAGYDNSDPWYDGRGHNYTIVDAPRQGTMLSADKIEDVFLTFAERSAEETR